MKQPWINSAKSDSIFILLPPFLILLLVLVFNEHFIQIQNEYSFLTWLILIVFIDVSHVYSTTFKTYLEAGSFAKHRKLLILLPIICFIVGIVLFGFGSNVFWSVLAYVAVFHFVRQQYGFMRLYSRKESFSKTGKFFDSLFIYSATLYPMVYWFMSPDRNFTWFMTDEFFKWQNQEILRIITQIYYCIVIFFIVRTIYVSTKNKFFNFPKNAVITGTYLSWYFGIVYFNNDLVFTLLNVVSHGIPYMALIYFNQKNFSHRFKIPKLSTGLGFIFYVLAILLLAFGEEFLWESLVWKEHFQSDYFFENLVSWQILLVPLLTVPQFTHYILDGFIWKSKN